MQERCDDARERNERRMQIFSFLGILKTTLTFNVFTKSIDLTDDSKDFRLPCGAHWLMSRYCFSFWCSEKKRKNQIASMVILWIMFSQEKNFRKKKE